MRLNLEEFWYFYGLQQEEAPGKKIKEFVAGANQKLTETHVSRRESRKQHWGATGKASRMRTKNTTYGIQWCGSLWWPLFVGYFCFFFLDTWWVYTQMHEINKIKYSWEVYLWTKREGSK